MATKVDRKKKGAPVTGASASTTSDLSVLHPNRTFELAGRGITVREYGHIEGLRLLAWAKPFTDDLYDQVARGSHAPSVASMAGLMATHADLMRDMVAQSITPADDTNPGVLAGNAGWVEQLNDIDGDLLMMVWWQVNAGFFIRRLLGRAAAEKVEARQLAGHASTTLSSPPATDATPTTSAG